MFEEPTISSSSSVADSPTARLQSVKTLPTAVNAVVEPDTTRPSTRERKASRVSWVVETIALLAALALHAVPWLVEGYVWCGWLGMALAMMLATNGGYASRLPIMWLWCTGAIGLAFHWSPAAIAYTMSSGFMLGLLVAAPLILWEGLRLALTYWLAARLTRDVRYIWLATASTGILLEYIMPGVFPWKLGCIQLNMPWTIQAVDIFGGSYATFVAFAIAGALHIASVRAWQWYRGNLAKENLIPSPYFSTYFKALLLSPVVIALVTNALYSSFAWSSWKQRIAAAPKIRVGLIQVDPSYKESPANALALTGLIRDDVDLVCWPESSGGNYELGLQDVSDSDRVFQMSRDPMRGLRPWPQPGCELLLAGKNYVGDPYDPSKLFVTAMLLNRQECISGRYNKRFLMPFGEYVPAKDFVPGLSSLFDMDEEINPGSSACVLGSDTGARIGTMLCYEDMVPQAARDAIAENANLLVSLINGSAFENPLTLYQHRLLSQMRSIECRRYFPRCAATGETCVINPLGEVEARLPMQTNDALVCDVALLEGRTIYSRFPWLTPILGCGLLATCLIRASRVRDGIFQRRIRSDDTAER